jgi:hypothetical protein
MNVVLKVQGSGRDMILMITPEPPERETRSLDKSISAGSMRRWRWASPISADTAGGSGDRRQRRSTGDLP